MVRQKKQYRKQYRKLRNLIAINNPRQIEKFGGGLITHLIEKVLSVFKMQY